MKTNLKALQLVEKGLSSKTISKLTESQIDILHKKMIGEQPVSNPKIAAKIKDLDVLKQKVGELGADMKNIGLEEDEDLDDSAEKEGGYDPYAGNSVGNDNGPGEYGNDPKKDKQMDDGDADGMGIFEEKDGEPNPWAICHAQVGPKKTRKFERCVMSVKKQLKEGKNPVSLFLESQIQKIVEKHMPPKITKGDLMKYISENSPSTAPSPTTKPAPTKPDTKPGRRQNPFKNPNPGENPAPKAKKVSPEDAKEKVIDVIMQLIQK